jgi:hypothetical protein
VRKEGSWYAKVKTEYFLLNGNSKPPTLIEALKREAAEHPGGQPTRLKVKVCVPGEAPMIIVEAVVLCMEDAGLVSIEYVQTDRSGQQP